MAFTPPNINFIHILCVSSILTRLTASMEKVYPISMKKNDLNICERFLMSLSLNIASTDPQNEIKQIDNHTVSDTAGWGFFISQHVIESKCSD